MLGPDGINSDNWQENDGIDGWRLDVPNCVENQNFWNLWRDVVKGCNKDGYITAELWGDARAEINDGVKYDTVMNYEWLKTTVGYFINQGSEFNKQYKLKPSEFFRELKVKRNWYPLQALQVSQNLNGSHDTDRLLSRIVNDGLGRDLEEGKQIERGIIQ
jgi:glycosidase